MSAHRPERLARAANGGDVQCADSLFWSVMSTYVYRFVGLETLPGRLTDFDLQQFFQFGTGDVEAIRQRFRSDRRGPVHFGHINFRGTFRFRIDAYASAVLRPGASSGAVVKV